MCRFICFNTSLWMFYIGTGSNSIALFLITTVSWPQRCTPWTFGPLKLIPVSILSLSAPPHVGVAHLRPLSSGIRKYNALQSFCWLTLTGLTLYCNSSSFSHRSTMSRTWSPLAFISFTLLLSKLSSAISKTANPINRRRLMRGMKPFSITAGLFRSIRRLCRGLYDFCCQMHRCLRPWPDCNRS